MPIPFEKPHPQDYDTDIYMFREKRIRQTQKRSLLPRRCYISGKPLWFKRCEVVTSMVTGPGASVFETFWCDPQEFLLYELKRID